MIRFHNGKLLTMNGDMDITQGEVWVEENMILYVGPETAEHPAFDREIDLRGDLLMPGFKNAHTHSAMTFLRSYADDLPLHSWLFDKVLPLEAKLTPDGVYAFTQLAILEYLAGGVTASFDMYYHRQAYAQANIDSGFRTAICGALSAQGDNWDTAEQDMFRFGNMHPLISYLPGIHAEYTGSPELLMFMKQLVDAYGAPFWAHNSETAAEVAGCLERHGLTPTALYEEYGLFEHGGGGFHCVHLSEEDMDIFARRGLWVVSCPASNSKLASGVAPIVRMRQKGVNVALGTDGPASNNALSMFREMYLVTVLQKLRENDAAACDAKDVLRMAASGGALAMGLRDCDCIAAGKQADLIVIDLHRPNMQPGHDPVRNLVYSGSDSNVRLTMVAGRILYEDGIYHIGAAPEDIYAAARRETEKILRA